MTEYLHTNTYDFASMKDADLIKLSKDMEAYGKAKGVIGKTGIEPIAKDAHHDAIVETVTNIHNYLNVRLTELPSQAAKSKDKKKESAAKPKSKAASTETETNEQETTVAKKASKTTAKKTPAKKEASKAAAPRGTYKPEQKITVKLKENPCRKGTQQHDFVAKLMKHHGKTVGDFFKSGGASHTLKRAVASDWIKVS